MARILIVDGEAECRSALRQLFERLGHGVEEAQDAREATSIACSGVYDLAILDLDLPKRGGIRTLGTIREECPELPVIVTAGSESIETAIKAIKLGAYHYVAKPLNLEEVRITAERALDYSRLVNQNHNLLRELKERYSFENLIGKHPHAREAYELAAQVAHTDSAVLIIGEAGTGKEYLARTIHYQSKRAGAPFIRINCSGPSERQLERELFGDAAGAGRHVGCFELAREGTVFLEEVAHIAPSVQARLLRALQERPCARIITGSSRDPMAAAGEEKFSSDLYRRLSGVVIALPPLRDRREDIPAFADFFITKYSAETGKSVRSIADDAMEQLLACEWRGNIRELENCIERSIILCDGDCIQPAHLALNGTSPFQAKRKQVPIKSLREIERDHIKKVLTHCNWNRSAAASILEIDRKTLRSKIREFGFTPPPGK